MLTIENAHVELIKFREKNGFTQEKLSEKTGVSKPTIISIESGKKKPQATTIYKLNGFISLFAGK